MRNRHRIYSEIFGARNPLASNGFQFLRDVVAAGSDAPLLRDFFVALNRRLASALGAAETADLTWAADICRALVAANPELTVATIGGLLNDTTLQFRDPLVAVVFETAIEAPPLFSLLADVVQMEKQLVQFRVRAAEALVTKSPGEMDAGAVGIEAQLPLRFLNGVLDDLERGGAVGFDEACVRWADGFGPLTRALAGEERQMVEWAQEALVRLTTTPTARETMRVVLRILRANSPIPAWHPAGAPVAGQDSVGSWSALVVDKAIQVVLGVASARWWAEAQGGAASRSERPTIDLWPFNARVLEAALVDSSQPPRVRVMAAGLLRVLDHASPSTRLSPRALLYSELFLAPYQRETLSRPESLSTLDTGERLELLLEALGDNCEGIRRAAAEACQEVALQHPGSFQPRHYTKLLPFLSDDDPGIRMWTMRTFRVLAGFRTRRVAAVLDDISARLAGEAESDDEEEERARRDLEIALGITMDRLVDDVEKLQQEVQALEGRRRELLQYLESEAVRVGEEIHHEVLNTLTGYLATAIDEGDYRDAKQRLDNLVAELRRIMNKLYPRDLETEGFLQTLRNRLRDTKAHIERRTPGYVVELDCASEVTDATVAECVGEPAHLVLLYRVILEAIINARKHSGGTFIGVSVRAPEPGSIEVVVEDNGSGQGGPFGASTGMSLMHRRAEEIGACIEYQGTPTGGTAVVVRLTRPEAEADRGTNPSPAAKVAPWGGGSDA